MDMSDPDQREEAWFEAALQLPSKERAAYLVRIFGFHHGFGFHCVVSLSKDLEMKTAQEHEPSAANAH